MTTPLATGQFIQYLSNDACPRGHELADVLQRLCNAQFEPATKRELTAVYPVPDGYIAVFSLV